MSEPARASRAIALVGLSGAGKSTVAPLLARRLALPLLDTDLLVAEAAGLPVPAIFAERGERTFRAMEEGAVAFAIFQSPAVIATGGGVVLSANNRALLRSRTFVVWLDAPDDVLLKRLANDGVERPLLAGDGAARLAALRAARAPLYALVARLTIMTTELTPEETVDWIVTAFNAQD